MRDGSVAAVRGECRRAFLPRRAVRIARKRTGGGSLCVSQLVMFAVIVATVVTLNTQRHTDVASAAEAAQALQPLAGPASKILFALGFIGAGFLAVPVLAGSAPPAWPACYADGGGSRVCPAKHPSSTAW